MEHPGAARRRKRNELVRQLGRARGADEIFATASRRLRQIVPFDAAAWMVTDPATGFPTAPSRIDELDSVTASQCSEYWRQEFVTTDANHFRHLARAPRPAAALRVTLGDAEHSARYRNTVRPLGFGDELRAAFVAGDAPWGSLTLWRRDGKPAFSAGEVSLVASLSAPIGEALRARAVPPDDVCALSSGQPPGVMTFDLDGNLLSADGAAHRWLAELPVEQGHPTDHHVDVPVWLRILVLRAGAVMPGGDGTARARVRLADGRWLVFHASCLLDGAGAATLIVIVIEPATPAEIAPIVVAAYELSPREEQITRLVARGLGTADIAAELHVSAHTVRDHLKSIFQKVQVSSRGELVAKLFADHYEPVHLRHGHGRGA